MRRALLTVAVTTALVAGSGVAATAQTDPAAADIIAALPAELGSLYDNYSGTVTVAQLPELSAGLGPWKMCYSESYQGNPWRIALTNEMQRLANEFIASGALSEFKMADANGDVPTQITQVQSFIDEGCSIIVTVAGSATGLDEVIGKAAEAGIPVITNSRACCTWASRAARRAPSVSHSCSRPSRRWSSVARRSSAAWAATPGPRWGPSCSSC